MQGNVFHTNFTILFLFDILFFFFFQMSRRTIICILYYSSLIANTLKYIIQHAYQEPPIMEQSLWNTKNQLQFSIHNSNIQVCQLSPLDYWIEVITVENKESLMVTGNQVIALGHTSLPSKYR